MSPGKGAVVPVDIIILSFNTKERTMRCLKWLKLGTKYPEFYVTVIDNSSTDGSKEALRTLPWIKLIENPINVGVSKGWNQGIKYVWNLHGRLRDRYIMLLNSDTLVAAGWLRTLVGVLESSPRIGIASYGDMTNPNRSVLAEVENLSFVCPLIRGEVFEDIGLFEERLFAWHSDSLFCKKARRAGWRILVTPENLVYHFGASSAVQLPKYLIQVDSEMASKIEAEEFSGGSS